MMAILIRFAGIALSCVPYPALNFFTELLGKIFFIFPSRRKNLLLSNLRYAFPSWSECSTFGCAKKSAALMFEMGLFSLTYRFLSARNKKRSLVFSTEVEDKLKVLRSSQEPLLILLPHVCLLETIAVSPFFRPNSNRKLGAVYRPNRNPQIDQEIKLARESTGLVAFSRKEGLLKAKKHLLSGNWLIVLFDQNAGDTGTLDLFLNRIVSYTSLPDSLVRSTKAHPVFVYPKRIGFFKAELIIEDIETATSKSVSSIAHKKLELLIRSDPAGLPEWLWPHGKWKVHARVESRYRMVVKRKHLIQDKKLERNTDFFIRMPNWLGDIVMAIPVLLAIRNGRPDVRFTIICKKEYKELLAKFNLGENFISLPKKSILYFWDFRKKIHFKPDNYLLFTNSLRSDIEAFLSGSEQRFGLNSPGRRRPLLTHSFDPQKLDSLNCQNLHQTRLWELMARRFGLHEEVKVNPLGIPIIKREKYKIGIIAGSSNTPGKRWSVTNWVSLIRMISKKEEKFEFYLYGTNPDKEITTKICVNTSSCRVYDLAGDTTLGELADELASCSLVIGNDTGSMHLANMVGTPVTVLFGPTNSTKTKPFFNSTCTIIHSSTGDINDIVVADVLSLNCSKPKV